VIRPRARNQNNPDHEPTAEAGRVWSQRPWPARARSRRDFAHELGGWDALEGMQAASVRCAAEMVALFGKARSDALHEGRADPDALVRLAGGQQSRQGVGPRQA
jgi:hypothetical protein